MLRSYLRAALRGLVRNRLATLLNGLCLSLAIAAALLALTYVRQELTFDAFHAKAERIFRSSCPLGQKAMRQEPIHKQRTSLSVIFDHDHFWKIVRHYAT